MSGFCMRPLTKHARKAYRALRTFSETSDDSHVRTIATNTADDAKTGRRTQISRPACAAVSGLATTSIDGLEWQHRLQDEPTKDSTTFDFGEKKGQEAAAADAQAGKQSESK